MNKSRSSGVGGGSFCRREHYPIPVLRMRVERTFAWEDKFSATRQGWSKGIGGWRCLHETLFVVQRVRIPPGQG